MKRKITFRAVLVVTILLSVALTNDLGDCLCIETGSGGTFSSGKLSQSLFIRLVEQMIEASAFSSNVQLFQYQGKDSFYAKLCDNEQEQQKFRRKFGIKSVSPECEEKCLTPAELAVKYAGKIGLLIFEIGNPCGADKYLWKIYKFIK